MANPERPTKKETPIYTLKCVNHGFIGYTTSITNAGFISIWHEEQYGCPIGSYELTSKPSKPFYFTDD